MTFPGPVPYGFNFPIDSDFYNPSLFYISAITLGQTTLITTSADHNYVVGQLVRLLIPPTYGTRQLNGQQGYVISIPAANQVILNIYSLGYDNFISSPTYGPTQPQIVPVGDVNTGIISSTGRVIPTTNIPGSFINVSPQ